MLNLTFPSHLSAEKQELVVSGSTFFLFFPSPSLIWFTPRSLLSPWPTCAVIYYSLLWVAVGLSFTSSCIFSPYRAVSPWLADKCRFGGAAQVAAFSFPGRNGFSHHPEASECGADAYRLRGYSERGSLGTFFFFFEEWCFMSLVPSGISAPLCFRLKGHRVILKTVTLLNSTICSSRCRDAHITSEMGLRWADEFRRGLRSSIIPRLCDWSRFIICETSTCFRQTSFPDDWGRQMEDAGKAWLQRRLACLNCNSFSLLRCRVKSVSTLYLHQSGFYLSEEIKVEFLNWVFSFTEKRCSFIKGTQSPQ